MGSQITRAQRGQQIAQHGAIKQLSENIWQVPSQSGNGFYEVTKMGETYACTCKDFTYRNHIVVTANTALLLFTI
jgi:hypothetical protein